MGYEDADDFDLRREPANKLACGRLPDTGDDLCSQPTLSRLENAAGLRDAIRLPTRSSMLDRLLPEATALGDTRHRRYLRRRPWAAAAVAAQCELR